MGRPILVQFKINTSLRGLGPALDLISSSIRKLRRWKCFTPIPSVVGGLHAEQMRNYPKVWIAHAHVVVDALDLDDDLDEWEEDMKTAFRQLTGGRGVFSIADDPKTDIEDAARTAWYLFKPETCSPKPRSLGLKELDGLLDALHGRTLTIRLGASTRRGRRFTKAAPVP